MSSFLNFSKDDFFNKIKIVKQSPITKACYWSITILIVNGAQLFVLFSVSILVGSEGFDAENFAHETHFFSFLSLGLAGSAFIDYVFSDYRSTSKIGDVFMYIPFMFIFLASILMYTAKVTLERPEPLSERVEEFQEDPSTTRDHSSLEKPPIGELSEINSRNFLYISVVLFLISLVYSVSARATVFSHENGKA